MNQSGNRYKFEPANSTDSRELLEIMEEDKSPGNISLIYTRLPDAMNSFGMEGDRTSVIVCRDEKNKIITGFGALTVRQLFINKKETNIGYLFGIKVRKNYRKKIRIHKGYDLLKYLYSDIPFHFTSILDDNPYVQRMLEKKRVNMPLYIPYGYSNIYVLKTGFKKRLEKAYRFKRCTKEDIDQMISFVNEQGKNMQFFPVLSKKYLESNPSLTYKDFYLLYKNEELVACGAIWDQKSYKQLYVGSYTGIYKYIYRFPSVLSLFGYPKLVKPGNRVNYFSLAHWIVKNNNERDFEVFMNSISGITAEYSYFLIGVHEKNKYNSILKTKTKTVYKSKLYLVNWDHNKEINLDKNLIPYIESGAL